MEHSDVQEPGQRRPDEFQKADVLHRFIAKFIDFLIVAALAKMVPPVGYFAGMTFLLISDGLLEGQSPGKRLIGLQAVLPERGIPVGLRESILRNIPLAAAFFCLLALPYLGWILAVIIIGIEAVLVIGNLRGLRLGDELAKSQVVEGTSLTRPVQAPPEPVS